MQSGLVTEDLGHADRDLVRLAADLARPDERDTGREQVFRGDDHHRLGDVLGHRQQQHLLDAPADVADPQAAVHQPLRVFGDGRFGQ